MNVTLFGANGKTGEFLIKEGLLAGFELTVLVRSSTRFDNSNVRVVRGELADADALAEAIRGAGAVLSALGPTSLRHPANMPIAAATNAIIAATKRARVKRLIAVSTGTAVDPDDSCRITRLAILGIFSGLQIKSVVTQ